MCVTQVVIVDNGPSIIFFLYLIEMVCMVLSILNTEGHPHFMINSKGTTILIMFFIHDLLAFIWIWNQPSVDNGGVRREGQWLLVLVTGGRLHMIWDM